jgi:quercetin dioxygenase-like cupin family protein
MNSDCLPPRYLGGDTELHRGEVAGAGDLEVVIGLIERSGESVGAKHYHPGGEFGLVLSGAITVVAEGEPGTILKAGDSFYLPPGGWHTVGTTTEGSRTVVFRVFKRGEPMVVAAGYRKKKTPFQHVR